MSHFLCILLLTSYVLSCCRLGTVYIYIKLIFENLINVPTEAVILTAANNKLQSKLKTEQAAETQKLGQLVTIQNITFYSEFLS